MCGDKIAFWGKEGTGIETEMARIVFPGCLLEENTHLRPLGNDTKGEEERERLGRELLPPHLGPSVCWCPWRGFLGLASPTKVDFTHPAYGPRCLRVLICQRLGPGCQGLENTEIQVGSYRASFVWQGQDQHGVVSTPRLKTRHCPPPGSSQAAPTSPSAGCAVLGTMVTGLPLP